MDKRQIGDLVARGLSGAAGASRSALGKVADRAKAATPEKKFAAVGGAAGGAAAATAGTHIGIAAFGTAVSGAALLPFTVCIGVGAVAGYAGYKLYKDVAARRAKAPASNNSSGS